MFVGGQPGAGKTQAQELAKKLNQGHDIVNIVGDDFRQEHPYFVPLVLNAPRRMPQETAQIAGQLTGMAVDYALNNGYSCMVEGTWRNPSTVLDTAMHSKSCGRTNHAIFVAVNPAVSAFSTMFRYFGEPSPMQARWTEPSAHEAALAGIPKTMSAISKSGLFDRYTLTNRDGDILYDGSNGLEFKVTWREASRLINADEFAFIDKNKHLVEHALNDCEFATDADRRFLQSALQEYQIQAVDFALRSINGISNESLLPNFSDAERFAQDRTIRQNGVDRSSNHQPDPPQFGLS